jgi:hypothetical protein
MCAMHDVTGALTLVLSDAKWELMPVNLTNHADVANSQPAVYRQRPAYDMPVAHVNNATSAAVNIHRMATTRSTDFTFASSSLTSALLASIGATNTDILRTIFPAFAPYMLTPMQIVVTVATQHGVTTGDDVSKLLSPLSQPLTSLNDLTKHMSSFLLASQRLTRSGQGETVYKYFKMFLETVAGFPSIGMCLTTYYTAHPVIVNQSVVTLFPYLETMKDHLLKSDPGTPFSGSAQHQGNRQQRRANQTNEKLTRRKATRTPNAPLDGVSMAPPYSPPHRHRHPLPTQTMHPTSWKYSGYSRHWQHRTVPHTTLRVSICRLPHSRLPFSRLPDPVNSTAGYMGGTTLTMDLTAKPWAPTPSTLLQ